MGAVTLLPRYDRNNGWFETLAEVPPAAPLSGPTEADVVVVGAGFTGLAAARRLAELRPDARILLSRPGRIGNSAAGRSSGFAIDHAHNVRSKGFADTAEYERQQIALNRAGQAYLAEAVTAHGIDCDWTWAGKTHAACTDRGARDLEHFARPSTASTSRTNCWTADATVDRLGIDYYHRALHTPGTVLHATGCPLSGAGRHPAGQRGRPRGDPGDVAGRWATPRTAHRRGHRAHPGAACWPTTASPAGSASTATTSSRSSPGGR